MIVGLVLSACAGPSERYFELSDGTSVVISGPVCRAWFTASDIEPHIGIRNQSSESIHVVVTPWALGLWVDQSAFQHVRLGPASSDEGHQWVQVGSRQPWAVWEYDEATDSRSALVFREETSPACSDG